MNIYDQFHFEFIKTELNAFVGLILNIDLIDQNEKDRNAWNIPK